MVDKHQVCSLENIVLGFPVCPLRDVFAARRFVIGPDLVVSGG